jgi:hypothetical protein
MHLPIPRRIWLLAGCVFTLAALRSPAAEQPARPLSLEERIILVAPGGSEREDKEIMGWQQRIRAEHEAGPQALGNYERLGWAYISKARRTLDAGYYKLAEKTADVMDQRFGPSDDALRCAATSITISTGSRRPRRRPPSSWPAGAWPSITPCSAMR